MINKQYPFHTSKLVNEPKMSVPFNIKKKHRSRKITHGKARIKNNNNESKSRRSEMDIYDQQGIMLEKSTKQR